MNWERDVENTPSFIYCWSLLDTVQTSMEFGDEVTIYLISEHPEKGSDPKDHSFDFDFIESVISELDSYYTKAIACIKDELRKNASLFGISAEKATEIIQLEAEDFPVEYPSVVFYENDLWMIRFADADFPVINYGYGITISFTGKQAYEVEILPEDPEFIE